MDSRPTATDPTKLTLAQADLLRFVAEAGVLGVDRNGWRLSAAFNSLQALERRGLVTLKTEPTGYDQPKWKQTWLVTGLGLDVLKGGLVHTDHERQADGSTRLLVFLNGQQVGEVRHVPGYYPPMGQGRKHHDGWIGIDRAGRRLDFPKRDMAVAWVAGGAR